MSMTMRPILLALALSLPTAALAQRAAPVPEVYQEAVPPPEAAESTNNKALDRRLDRDEKALRELRNIVLKAQAQGAPVEVKPAGPDPIVGDLQARFGDLETTARDLTGQVERLGHDLDQSRKDAAQARAEINALNDKVERLLAQPAPAEAAAPDPQTGGPPAPTAPAVAAAPDENTEYQQARQVLDSGDFAGGAAAMQAFVLHFPNSPRVGTAQYWSGRAYAARNQHAEAAAAFARSLKGWPQASWAGDSVVQLAGSLTALKRPADACKALGEFDARYAAKASTNTRALAVRARANADCS